MNGVSQTFGQPVSSEYFAPDRMGSCVSRRAQKPCKGTKSRKAVWENMGMSTSNLAMLRTAKALAEQHPVDTLLRLRAEYERAGDRDLKRAAEMAVRLVTEVRR